MAVMTRSVAFDPAVGEEALEVAGERGFSRFVNDAVAQRLQAIRIEALYRDHGGGPSVPDNVRALPVRRDVSPDPALDDIAPADYIDYGG